MRKLTLLSLPRHRTSKGDHYLDPVRKQLVPATREEQVRQSVIACLVKDYGYPIQSLLSEEPIARGTQDRRRADVIIHLPARSVPGKLSVVEDREPGHCEPAYSEKLHKLKGHFEPGKDITLVTVPDEFTVPVAGHLLTCKTLGFVRCNDGFCLGFEPPKAESERLGLPPILGILVAGHGLTHFEKDVAQRLAIPECEWSFQASLDFMDALIGVDEDPGTRLSVEANALSSDGIRGGTILMAGDLDELGVLVWVDMSKAEPRAEHEPERAPRSSKSADLDQTAESWKPIAVIECKAPAVPLTEEVTKQGLGYATKLQADFLVVTNGAESKAFAVTPMQPIKDLPSYESVVSGHAECVKVVERDPYRKLNTEAARHPDIVRFHRRFRDNVGSETPEALWPILIALDDALHLATSHQGFTATGLKFLEDLGVNFHVPGSPTGAGWPGEYRDFLVEDSAGHRFVFGLGLQSAWSVVNKDMLSKSVVVPGAWTYLLAAVSEGSEYESVLQVPLDKSLTKTSTGWVLAHDGKMTAGKGGVSPTRVVEAVLHDAPDLVRNGRIILGEIPGQIPLDTKTTQRLLGNLARYVVVRRALKVEVKKERKKRRS